MIVWPWVYPTHSAWRWKVNFLGSGNGGSVMLSRAFHSALSKSVRRHFPDSDGEKGEGGRIIHCMCHDSEILLQVGAVSSRCHPMRVGGVWLCSAEWICEVSTLVSVVVIHWLCRSFKPAAPRVLPAFLLLRVCMYVYYVICHHPFLQSGRCA